MNGNPLSTKEAPEPPEWSPELDEKTEATGADATPSPPLVSAKLDMGVAGALKSAIIGLALANNTVAGASKWTVPGAKDGALTTALGGATNSEAVLTVELATGAEGEISNEKSAADDPAPTAGPGATGTTT